MLKSVYKAVAEEMEGITFLEVNIDDNREVTNEFGVKNIPTIILVKDGEVTKSNSEGLERRDTNIPDSNIQGKRRSKLKPKDPNYDLFKLAIQTTSKRLFPNFYSDAPIQ